jgi:hypothetical protein
MVKAAKTLLLLVALMSCSVLSAMLAAWMTCQGVVDGPNEHDKKSNDSVNDHFEYISQATKRRSNHNSECSSLLFFSPPFPRCISAPLQARGAIRFALHLGQPAEGAAGTLIRKCGMDVDRCKGRVAENALFFGILVLKYGINEQLLPLQIFAAFGCDMWTVC